MRFHPRPRPRSLGVLHAPHVTWPNSWGPPALPQVQRMEAAEKRRADEVQRRLAQQARVKKPWRGGVARQRQQVHVPGFGAEEKGSFANFGAEETEVLSHPIFWSKNYSGVRPIVRGFIRICSSIVRSCSTDSDILLPSERTASSAPSELGWMARLRLPKRRRSQRRKRSRASRLPSESKTFAPCARLVGGHCEVSARPA